MNDSDLCEALRDAADELESGKVRPHATVGAVMGIPPWLLTILQLVGPPVLKAIQAWLSTTLPASPPQA